MTKPDAHASDPAKAHEADSPGIGKLLKKAKAITDQWTKNAEAELQRQNDIEEKQAEMQRKADATRSQKE